jgi:hypothetical protein
MKGRPVDIDCGIRGVACGPLLNIEVTFLWRLGYQFLAGVQAEAQKITDDGEYEMRGRVVILRCSRISRGRI